MDYYQDNAQCLAEQYNSLEPEQVHASWIEYLPTRPGKACDIGAGSGRDAHWLTCRGWDVVAVEPCKAMRTVALTNPGIVWVSDTLPGLSQLQGDSHCFDLILISAVWMHLTPDEQVQAFVNVKSLLAESGLMIITWRNQANEESRQFYPVNEAIFQAHRLIESQDSGVRSGVIWKTAIILGSDNEFAQL